MQGRMYQANSKEAFDYARPFRARSISPPKGALLNSMLSCAKVLHRRGRGAAENVSAELRKSASEKGPRSFGEALRRRARGAAEKRFGEGPAELRRSASEKRPQSFREVVRRSARGASEKRFGEAPAELRRSASEKGPRGFGEAVFLVFERGNGASEKRFGEAPAGLRRSASEKGPRSFGEVLRRSARGASEKGFGEGPAGLRRSASEKRPRSFGEVLRRRARGAAEKGFGEGPAGLRRSASEKRPRSFGEVLRRRAHGASQEGAAELLREALLEWLQKFAPASAGAPQISLGSSGPGPEVSKPAWPPLASFPCSCGLPCASPLKSAEAQHFYQSLILQSSRGNQGGGQLGRTGRGPSESLREPAKASEKVLARLLTLRQ